MEQLGKVKAATILPIARKGLRAAEVLVEYMVRRLITVSGTA